MFHLEELHVFKNSAVDLSGLGKKCITHSGYYHFNQIRRHKKLQLKWNSKYSSKLVWHLIMFVISLEVALCISNYIFINHFENEFILYTVPYLIIKFSIV